MGKPLNVEAEIASLDSIRAIVSHGRRATLMPVSVLNETQVPARWMILEVSGVQPNRQLLRAWRLESRSPAALSLLHGLGGAEISRLARQGVFSFGAAR